MGTIAIALHVGLEVALGKSHVHPATLAWNAVAEFVIFFVVAALVDTLRAKIEGERAGRLVAVDQLRHAERLNTIGKLAAGVAHELGTPLNVVMGRAELIAGERLPPDKVTDSAKVILRQAERMTAILRQLLHFGRRSGETRSVIDLRLVARQSADLLSPIAKKRQVELLYEADGQALMVSINASEIEQVLSNLIMNAIQASRDHSGVRVVAERLGSTGAVSVMIADEGSGIASDALERIFDPFFTTKGVGEGTGLGLSVSYGIVNDHGGRIDVESKEGEGSRFRVVLPEALAASGP